MYALYLYCQEYVQESQRVLATRQAQQQAVALLNHAPVLDGLAHALHDLLRRQMRHRLALHLPRTSSDCAGGSAGSDGQVCAPRSTQDLAAGIHGD